MLYFLESSKRIWSEVSAKDLVFLNIFTGKKTVPPELLFVMRQILTLSGVGLNLERIIRVATQKLNWTVWSNSALISQVMPWSSWWLMKQ